MSEEQLKAFLEAVKADAALQKKLQAATDANAAVAIAKEAGFVISAEAFKSDSDKRLQLSDEDLEGLAGGDNSAYVACYNTFYGSCVSNGVNKGGMGC
jgi:predicted ribosomally synthesized peptide with nif11-like leader